MIDEILDEAKKRFAECFEAEITGENRRYHCEMLRAELKQLRFEKSTRDFVFIDRAEREILSQLLTKELGSL